jgi:hypothetical protein
MKYDTEIWNDEQSVDEEVKSIKKENKLTNNYLSERYMDTLRIGLFENSWLLDFTEEIFSI